MKMLKLSALSVVAVVLFFTFFSFAAPPTQNGTPRDSESSPQFLFKLLRAALLLFSRRAFPHKPGGR